VPPSAAPANFLHRGYSTTNLLEFMFTALLPDERDNFLVGNIVFGRTKRTEIQENALFAEDWIGAKKSHFFTVFLAPKEHRSRECEFVKRLGMLATSSPEFGFEKKERHFAFCCGRRKPKIF
jgi:hypothetical protein